MWKESYRVGVEKINTQHQELFRRVSDFLAAFTGEGTWDDKINKVKETAEFMQSYVVEHFSDEEVYQKTINYIHSEKHHQIHEEFKAEVTKIAQKLVENDYSEEIAQEFGGKLMTWLIYHVAIEDQKIGDYVRRESKNDES